MWRRTSRSRAVVDDRHARHAAPGAPASDSLIAQGWYKQGARFLDVLDPRAIKQVGYYVNQGEFWLAYFAPGDPSRQVVYGLDVAGGIDVLKFDRSGAAARAVRARLPRRRTSVLPPPEVGRPTFDTGRGRPPAQRPPRTSFPRCPGLAAPRALAASAPRTGAHMG